jgi:hypothetical protein
MPNSSIVIGEADIAVSFDTTAPPSIVNNHYKRLAKHKQQVA